MTKEQYLSSLSQYLKKLPEEEREDIIREIQLHFTESYKKGLSDVNIIEKLGAPKQLAKSFLIEYDIKVLQINDHWVKYILTIGKLMAFGFKNILLLPIFLVIGLLFFSAYLMVFSFYLCGSLMIIAPVLKLISPAFVSTDVIPIWIFPLGGIPILYFTRSSHRFVNSISKKMYEFLLKYIKVDLEKMKNVA